MEQNLNTFERLVLTMKSSERQDLLKRIAEVSEAESDRQPAKPLVSDPVFSVDQRLAEEPLLVRLWFNLRAFFSTSTASQLFALSLVAKVGKNLSRSYGVYIDPRQGVLLRQFYEDLLKLKQTASFFSGLLASVDNDKGGFFLFLGSMIMTGTDEKLVEQVDPFKISVRDESSADHRTSLLRKMDSVLSSIPEEERARMYQAVQSIEWIKAFCAVSFDRILLRFNTYGQKTVCNLDTVTEDLRMLARVLSATKRIPVIVLEAMHLFTVQEKVQEPRFDLEQECTAFVSRAASYLSNIKVFRSAVPIADIVRFALRDVAWTAQPIEGGEDWFVIYKAAWKRNFDQKWGYWQRAHRREMVVRNILQFLDVKELPGLQYHPWEDLWLDLSFRREMSIGFIKAFYKTIYPDQVLRPLKLVLIEGEFYRRENLNEFTDTFNVLEHMQQNIEYFENRLGPKGDLGSGFEVVRREKIATTKGKARLDNLVMMLESSADEMIHQLTNAFRTMDQLLGGILAVVRGGPYETLVNLAAIQGKGNEKFRQQLARAREMMNTASALLGDAEVVEKEST